LADIRFGSKAVFPAPNPTSAIPPEADIARQPHLACDTAATAFASATVRIEFVNRVLPRDVAGTTRGDLPDGRILSSPS
jgi:hypothetical protein